MNKTVAERILAAGEDLSPAALREMLYTLRNGGSRYGIERMQRLASAMGHPEREFPAIHVAGTNGKGSVCAMLAATYQSRGLKTGLFTSPHLVHLGERIRINGEMIQHPAFVEGSREIARAVVESDLLEDDWHPTFFEWITALGFWTFARAKVDIAIIETGLGGRLDATNVLVPEVSIITSIGLDHTEILGHTEALIAAEKGGIIKAGVPVIAGIMSAEAETVLRTIARSRQSPFFSVLERWEDKSLPDCIWPGEFQRRNRATALLAGEVLGPSPWSFTASELDQALTGGKWGGRWEKYLKDGRTIILDATHNAEGAVFLRQQVKKLVDEIGQPLLVVFGSTGKDRAQAVLEAVLPFTRELFPVSFNQPRALPTKEILALLPTPAHWQINVRMLEELFPRNGELQIGSPGDTILVSGSIYLIGEVLAQLEAQTADTDLQG